MRRSPVREQSDATAAADPYRAFLEAKVVHAVSEGYEVAPEEIHPILKPHQRDIVRWAVRGGRRAIFASFGLGKSLIQIETVRLIAERAGGRGLIVLPLGVRQEFTRDARMVGVSLKFIRRMEEAEDPAGLYLTNYETVRDAKLDPTQFSVTSLDEASVLRGFGGTKTFREFMRRFEGSGKFRFVATATPDPNEYIELLAYAAFLDVMDVSAAKTRFFKRDSTHADRLTLHPHKEREFWLWVASWAIFLQKPSDLGHSDEGYALPAMDVRWHEIPSDHSSASPEKHGQGRLFREATHGVTEAAREKRDSLAERIERMVQIVRDEGILQKLLPDAQEGISSSSPGILPREQGTRERSDPELAAGQPGTGQGLDPHSCRTQPREHDCSQPGMVRAEQNTSECDEPQEQTPPVWPNSEGVRGLNDIAGRTMRDLPGHDDNPGSGPRSYNWGSEGTALPQLQCGAGPVSGRPGFADPGRGIYQQFIVWCDLNAEQRAIERALNDLGISYSSLYGSTLIEEREAQLETWRRGETAAFVSKPVMYGSGVNLQQCCRAVFLGIGFKFSEFIQATARIHRFLQTRPVRIDLIYTEAERPIRQILEGKWARHAAQVERMGQIIREYGLAEAALAAANIRSIGCERVEVAGEGYRLILNDAVEETRTLETDSVDLIITSVPFATQYEYTPCYDEHTEVLTRSGWRSFGEITLDDSLATVNPATRCLEWQAPSGIVWQPYDGPMLHFRGRNSFDLLVTPDHKMFVDTRVGNLKTGRKTTKYDFVRAERVAEIFAHRKWRMVTGLTAGAGMRPAFIDIPASGQRVMPRSRHIARIATEDFMALAGWYLSEGSCRDGSVVSRRGEISIAQSAVHPAHRKEIIDLFRRIGLPTNANHATSIRAWNISVADYLRAQFGLGSYSKRIPRWVKDLHPDLLRILRDTMMKGDGNANGMAYTSVSKSLRDDFQEVCLLTGWRAAVSGDVVRIGQRSLNPEIRERPQRESYRGMIGCATVPSHTLVVRRNGKAIVSGNSYNDFGHTDNNDHFWAQMDFLTPELLRALRPGRVAAIHVKDRVTPGGITGLGFQTVQPFHAEAIFHYRRHGFAFLGMKTIVTDVVRENNQTYRLGWTEQCKDGSKMGAGMSEYLLLFRKPPTDSSNGYADTPVVKDKKKWSREDAKWSHEADGYSRARWQLDAHGFTRSSGDRPLSPEDLVGLPSNVIYKMFRKFSLSGPYDFERHVTLAESLEQRGQLPSGFMLLPPQSWHPDVWTDVARMRTLNMMQERKGQQMHLCLARGSLVLTRSGYTPIQDVPVGAEVLTHKGRWRSVLAVEHTGRQRVVTVKAHGVPGLTLTPGHALWTRPTRDLAWSLHHSRREAKNMNPRWVRADETLGDYLNLRLPSVEAPSVPQSRHWWVVGRWLADGHVDAHGGAILSCGRHEVSGLIALLGEYYGVPPYDTRTGMQFRLRDPGHELRRTLKECGHGAAGKHLPPEAYTLPVEQARALLDGYLSGDGHYLPQRRRWMASSVSRALLLGVAMLAQRAYSALASVYSGRHGGPDTIQGRTVTAKQEWILSFDVPDATRKKGLPFIAEDGAWKRVRSIVDAGETETWNLRLADDESYTAEGCIVKNCPLQFDIVDRLIVQFSMSGETILDPFAGLMTVPYCAVKLGRSGIGIELNAGYFRDGALYVEAAARQATVPTLFDLSPDAEESTAAMEPTEDEDP